MSDWKERPSPAAEVLRVLIDCLRMLRREEEALLVLRHALTLPPDGARPTLEVSQGFDEALAGDANQAAERLARVDYKGLAADQQFVYRLAQAMIELSPAGRACSGEAAGGACRVGAAGGPLAIGLGAGLRAGARSRGASGVSTPLWCLWRRAIGAGRVNVPAPQRATA